jgi:hypothetical protein
VELADLVRDVLEDLGDRDRVERRAIGRDPPQGQSTLIQRRLEAAEEVGDVVLVGVVVEDAVGESLEGPVVDDRQDAERPIVELVGGDLAREISQRPREIVRGDASHRLFPPGLNPVLERGAGNENAMIPPEVPARSSERYTVLDDQADGQVDDALGVVASRRRQIGGVRVEVLATLGAVVLGVGQDDVVWSSGMEIAEVV